MTYRDAIKLANKSDRTKICPICLRVMKAGKIVFVGKEDGVYFKITDNFLDQEFPEFPTCIDLIKMDGHCAMNKLNKLNQIK